MRFFNKLLAPCFSGLAFSKFIRKKYVKAIPLFKKVIDLEPNYKHLESIYSCLGRCYLAVKEYDNALEALSISYGIYQTNRTVLDEFGLKEYRELLIAYGLVLKHFQKAEQAAKISTEKEQIEKVLKKMINFKEE